MEGIYSLPSAKNTLISPYISARIGYASHKSNVLATTRTSHGDATVKYHALAYGLGIGTEVNLSNNVAVDLSYNVNNFGFKNVIIDIGNISGTKGDAVAIKKVKLNQGVNLLIKFKF